MPAAPKFGKPKKGSKARNPMRDTAFELFACGKSYEEIGGLTGIPKNRLSRWRTEDDWDARLKVVQAKYLAKLDERLAGKRAAADAGAIESLLGLRGKLILAMETNLDGIEPGKLAGALRAVQEVMAKITPSAPSDDGDDDKDTIGFDFYEEDYSAEG